MGCTTGLVSETLSFDSTKKQPSSLIKQENVAAVVTLNRKKTLMPRMLPF